MDGPSSATGCTEMNADEFISEVFGLHSPSCCCSGCGRLKKDDEDDTANEASALPVSVEAAEEKLARLLVSAFGKVVSESAIIADLDRATTVKQLRAALKKDRITSVWTSALDDTVTTLLNDMADTGAATLTPEHIRKAERKLTPKQKAARALEKKAGGSRKMVAAIRKQVKTATNQYFARIVQEPLLKKLKAKGVDLKAPDLVKTVTTQVNNGLLKSEPYFGIVANVATSRAYHYGMLDTARTLKYTGFRFVAVLDKRTSRICRAMNGKTFWIADALTLLDKVASAGDDVERVKKLTPWVDASDVAGKSTAALSKMGVMVPPLHPKCRSSVIPIK